MFYNWSKYSFVITGKYNPGFTLPDLPFLYSDIDLQTGKSLIIEHFLLKSYDTDLYFITSITTSTNGKVTPVSPTLVEIMIFFIGSFIYSNISGLFAITSLDIETILN